MNKILIKCLNLLNFKGIKEFNITDFNHGVSIYGDNATGKTTIFDAFCWLMFGKDSLNSAVFEIKSLTPSGEALHGLNHEVEAILIVNGNEVNLRKVFYEKYTKRRGEAERTFTGHTVDHFVNGVPCKQKEFQKTINNICNEENFKLLTNPRYFNEILHWTDRRRLLLTICGDISDKDVISRQSEALWRLPDILGKRSLEDQKKMIATKKAEINSELDKIPPRIDERHKSKVEISDDLQVVILKIEEAKQNKTRVEKEVVDVKTGGGIAEKTKTLTELEGKIQEHENVVDKTKIERQSVQRREFAEVERKSIEAASATEKAVIEQSDKLKRKAELKDQLALFDKQREKLRETWIGVNDKEFVPVAGDNLCAACGQKLPADQIENAARLALENFNDDKANELADISSKGKLIGDQIAIAEKDIRTVTDALKDMDDNIKSLAGLQDVAERAVDITKERHETEIETVPPDLELDDLIAQADTIKLKINALSAGNYEAILAVENELERAEKTLELYQKDKLDLENNEKADRRIDELQAKQRELSAQFEQLEADLFVIETFIRCKVSMLEKKINEKFTQATFRMFTENINGGLEECCDTTCDGVPYNSMNNGARINIGLDICNTLSEHYDISLPCFIDNSEAVTRLLQTKAQQIRLFVSENDKTLKVKNT